VLFPLEDDQVALAGKLIAGDLNRIGIEVEPAPIPGADMQAMMKEFVSSGQPVVAVSR
jgi:hypothetical protein